FKDIVTKLKEKGATILFSSHILSDVQDIADQIGIINHGKIKQIGSLNDLQKKLRSKKAVEVLLSYVTDKWNEFKSISNVKTVEQSSAGRILVHLEAGADEAQVIDDLVQTIVRLKIKVQGIRLLSPSLDEIYLNYVQADGVA
ncbi:MAG: hypothetical protein GX811_04670, partial [Lentisphaerae bacterium]|nr:hypothetical protein [Lentisphaerota bacterium]